MRAWHIEVYLLNHNGEEVPANVFEKAVYKLHPSFGKQRATQSMCLFTLFALVLFLRLLLALDIFDYMIVRDLPAIC